MIPLRLAEVAAVVGADLGARADPAAEVTSVTVDSRSVTAGSLFVALPGQHVDGHAFVPAALEQGAVAALTARPVPEATSACLVVPDPVLALGAVARAVVDRGTAAGLRVVGITGSSGKTSTKDLLAALLEPVGPTVAPHGNFNNELGVPLTVSRVAPDTRFLVCEMGARGVGHIAYLCRIAPPQIGAVLNVGQAHVGEFGSQAAIATAKAELVAALPPEGVAVLNGADPLVAAMHQVTAARVLLFSAAGEPRAGQPAVWTSSLQADPLGRYRFSLHSNVTGTEEVVPVELQLTGRHQVANAAAAAAIAVALGLDLDTISRGLSAARPRSRWRMELQTRADGLLVLNDSYNANPDSMRAALSTLAELGTGRAKPSTTWAVLGDMLELGDTAVAEHAALGRYVAQLGIDRLVTTGEHREIVVGAAVEAGMPPGRALAWEDKAALAEDLAAAVRPADVVLVKASRGLALDTVAEHLLVPSRTFGNGHRRDPA